MRGLDSKGSPGRNSELQMKIIEGKTRAGTRIKDKEKPEFWKLEFLKKWLISNARIGFKRKSWSELRTSNENNRGKTRAGTRIKDKEKPEFWKLEFLRNDWFPMRGSDGFKRKSWSELRTSKRKNKGRSPSGDSGFWQKVFNQKIEFWKFASARTGPGIENDHLEDWIYLHVIWLPLYLDWGENKIWKRTDEKR